MKLSASTQHIINREIARTFPKEAMFFIQLKRNGLSFRGQAVFILGYNPDGGIFFQAYLDIKLDKLYMRDA